MVSTKSKFHSAKKMIPAARLVVAAVLPKEMTAKDHRPMALRFDCELGIVFHCDTLNFETCAQ
jgi:hypothetical protein